VKEMGCQLQELPILDRYLSKVHTSAVTVVFSAGVDAIERDAEEGSRPSHMFTTPNPFLTPVHVTAGNEENIESMQSKEECHLVDYALASNARCIRFKKPTCLAGALFRATDHFHGEEKKVKKWKVK
jgi:hypothetical protein